MRKKAYSGRQAGGKYYVASDHLEDTLYRAITPQHLIDILIRHRLHFDQAKQTGIIVHMLATISENGRFGVVAVGDSHEQAEELLPHADDRPKRGATGHPGARHPRAKVSSALPRDVGCLWQNDGFLRSAQTGASKPSLVLRIAKALLQTGDRMCGFWAGRVRANPPATLPPDGALII